LSTAAEARTTRAIILFGFACCFGFGIAVPFASKNTAWLLSLSIAAVLIAAFAVRRLTVGHVDPFEPLAVFGVLWAIMFVIRPIAMLVTGDMSLRGIYDASDGLAPALSLALVGALAFVATYLIVPALSVRSPTSTDSLSIGSATHQLGDSRDSRVRVIALIFGGIGLAAALLSFAHGRGTTSYQSGYLTFAPLLVVPSALMIRDLRTGPVHLQTAVAVAGLFLITADYWLVGERFFGLLPLGSLCIYECLVRGYRPGPATVVVLVVGLAFLLSVLVNARPGVSAPADSHRGIVTQFVLNDTTAELPALAVQLETQGHVWNETPGYLPYSVLLHWVPKQLWPNKPESYEEVLYSRLFPGSYATARNGTEFSILGDFYYDSGLLGVIVGMAALGLLSRYCYDFFMRRGRRGLGAVGYSMVPILLVMVFRGDITLSIALIIYSYLPIAIAMRFGYPSGHAVGLSGNPPNQTNIGGPTKELWSSQALR
jgi:hypothetical protein